MSQESNIILNPYVGPRAFREGEELFGRPQELLRLLHLIIAERVVLLYSPSGAGKTSLIQAALIPELKKKKFRVLGPIRVGRELPQEYAASSVGNRYLSSLLLSLDQKPLSDEKHPQNLGEYLDQRAQESSGPDDEVLIFDQFEEILTHDPTDKKAKEDFFTQVGEVLEARHRWALFALREEYLAGLEPYARFIPTRFHNTFRLDLLGTVAACQAIQKPAANAGVDFTNDAAQELLQDLCKVRVQQPDGSILEREGPNVEPVQLQLVCYRLWEKNKSRLEVLPVEERKIEAIADKDKDEKKNKAILSDVNTALADYYDDKLAAVAQKTGVRERLIREWFDRRLITAQGIRGQVQQGPDQGLDLEVIRALVDAHLVREDQRRGATWFELAHDRFIEPVRSSNTAWVKDHLSSMQIQADSWNKGGKPETLLFKGLDLIKAESWAEDNQDQMTPVEQDFLTECQSFSEQVRREKRYRFIRLTVVAFLLLLIFATYKIYSNWLRTRPWGYITNLSTGTNHILRDNFVFIGRPTKYFPSNTIKLGPRYISRLHVFFDKEHLSVVDMRSKNGTTVNAKHLRYGEGKELNDKDVIVLAGMAPFQFSQIQYTPFQILVPNLPILQINFKNSWAIFINDDSQTINYLDKPKYFVGLNNQNKIFISVEKIENTMVSISKQNDTILFKVNKNNIELTLKGEDEYNYRSAYLKTNTNIPFELNILGMMTFNYKDKYFQIIPIFSDLEQIKDD